MKKLLMLTALLSFFYIRKKKKTSTFLDQTGLRISHTQVPKQFIDGNTSPVWDDFLYTNKKLN